MIRPVHPYGSQAYHCASAPWEGGTPDMSLLVDMWDTIHACNMPVLTAPHIGQNLRVAVVDTALGLRWRDDVEPAAQPFREVLIDPHIIQERGMLVSFLEYDAAAPGLVSSIARRKEVRARWTQADGQPWEQWLTGPAARAVLCVVDRLNGMSMVDLLSVHRKRSVKSHLKRLAEGKVQARYPMATLAV